ncbi:MAG: hypothetical protein A2Y56_06385 [Candidatus Aminicenantes bacterium RBG_13_63_10]|nr:MAG: hypothetical protein A2Y56_06385 [Candidatus Aminicenantes bacterium RBG_13_63_10]
MEDMEHQAGHVFEPARCARLRSPGRRRRLPPFKILRRLAVLDYHKRRTSHGPPLSHRVALSRLLKWLREVAKKKETK